MARVKSKETINSFGLALIIIGIALVTGCTSHRQTPSPLPKTATHLPPPATVTPSNTPLLPSPTLAPAPSSTYTPPPFTLTPTLGPQVEIVSFTTDDNVKLAGTLYLAEGDMAVVFAHMGISDQTAWQDFAAQVAGREISALTFDFRCYGKSECRGSSLSILTLKDIRAAIGFLREQGFSRIVCAGASMGAIACMNVALNEELAGLAVIAGVSSYPLDGKQFPEDLINPGMPKLFVVTEQDRYEEVRKSMPLLYDASPQPKLFKTFPGVSHGTELFETEYAEEFSQVLFDFLEEIRAAEPGMPRQAITPKPTGTATATTTSAPLNGKIIFYSERDGNAEIYVMHPDGSDPRRLTENNTNEFAPAWSPDGQAIIFETDRNDPKPVNCFPNCLMKLYIMDANGNNWRQLMDLPGSEGHANWSPDGMRIAFEADRNDDGKGEIYIVGIDDGSPQTLIADEADNRAADWSPDGKQIAFMSNLDGNYDIYVMDVPDIRGEGGSNIRKVVDTGFNDYFPDWSPDGKQIAFFAADWPSIRQDIYLINADGSDMKKLTDTTRVVDEDPKWSPDGAYILFQSNRDGSFDIYRMNSDGSNPQRLTRNAGQNYWPDWWMPVQQQSAAGSDKKIAFVSDRDGNGEIYIANADGSQPQRLTRNTVWDGTPTWSPDGTLIAYYTHLTEQSWAIMIMNADGSSPRQLTESAGSTLCSFGPVWSPDGRRIAFTIEPSSKPTCEMKHTEIAIINTDGSGFSLLTQNEANDLVGAWSPDGTQLVFSSNRDGNDEIYVMNADGTQPRRLTTNSASDILPAWSPDGQRITFTTDRDGNYEIYGMAADGSSPARLTQNPGWDYYSSWSPDGSLILFSSGQTLTGLDLYVMDADGTNMRKIHESPGLDFEASWQP
jgi:Tol biopolymer transport system component/pimeloyl-ACP methyl ester carboxylesterase